MKNIKLSDICEFQGGYSFKSKEYQTDKINSFELFRMGNISRGGGMNQNANHAYINKEKCQRLDRFILKKTIS